MEAQSQKYVVVKNSYNGLWYIKLEGTPAGQGYVNMEGYLTQQDAIDEMPAA